MKDNKEYFEDEYIRLVKINNNIRRNWEHIAIYGTGLGYKQLKKETSILENKLKDNAREINKVICEADVLGIHLDVNRLDERAK